MLKLGVPGVKWRLSKTQGEWPPRQSLGKGMRLLLVEDDEMIAETVLAALRRSSYTVDWAQDGRAAELSLGNDVYDLVLLDLTLPKRDGLDVLGVYRKNGGHAPVMILTARDAVDDRIRGLDAGADDYLLKPFDLDELAARVRAAAPPHGSYAARLRARRLVARSGRARSL